MYKGVVSAALKEGCEDGLCFTTLSGIAFMKVASSAFALERKFGSGKEAGGKRGGAGTTEPGKKGFGKQPLDQTRSGRNHRTRRLTQDAWPPAMKAGGSHAALASRPETEARRTPW